MTRSLNVVLCAHVDLVKKLARAIQLDNEHLIICSVNLDTQLTILPPYHLISAMPQVCIRKTDSPPYSSLCPALASVCSREASRSHSSTRLGQARSWDKPFNVLGPSPLLGQALQHVWDMLALGTSPLRGIPYSSSSKEHGTRPRGIPQSSIPKEKAREAA